MKVNVKVLFVGVLFVVLFVVFLVNGFCFDFNIVELLFVGKEVLFF